MRLKDAPENGGDGKENRPTQYFATLRDKTQVTPRSKQTRYFAGCLYIQGLILVLHREANKPAKPETRSYDITLNRHERREHIDC